MISYFKDSFFYRIIMRIYLLMQESFIFKFGHIKERERQHGFLYEHSLYYKIVKKLGLLIDDFYIKLNRLYEKSLFSGIVEFWINLVRGSFIFSKLKEISGLESSGKLILIIPVCYMAFDFLIRRMPVINAFGSVWDELFLIFMFLYAFGRRVYNPEIKSKQTAMGLPTLLFIMLGISHLLIMQPNTDVAIEGFRAMFQQFLWYFAFVMFIRERKDTDFFTSILSLFGLFLGLHACYQYVRGVPMPGNWTDVTEQVRTRAFSIAGSPNILGAMFVCLLPISVLKITKTRGYMRALHIMSFLSMFMGLLFTFSRGAWLSFIVVAIIFVLLLNIRLVFPFGFLGLIMLLTDNPISRRMLHLFSSSYKQRSGEGGRIYRWGVGLKVWERSKLFGVGLGRFGGAVAINNDLSPFYLDNYYLKTMVEMGLFGLVSMFLYILWFIIFSWKVIDSQKSEDIVGAVCIFSGAMGVLCQNFVENIFEVPAMMVIFFLMIAFLETYRVKE